MGVSYREERPELTAAQKVVIGVRHAAELAVEGFEALVRGEVSRFGFIGSDNVMAFVEGTGIGGPVSNAERVSSGYCCREREGVPDGPFGRVTSGFAVRVSSHKSSVSGSGVQVRNSVG